MTPVITFAKWQVRPGQLNTVLKLLKEASIKSRAETGNLFYKVHQSTNDENSILLYEGYADAAAVEAHRGSAHFKDIVIDKIVPLLEQREVMMAREVDM